MQAKTRGRSPSTQCADLASKEPTAFSLHDDSPASCGELASQTGNMAPVTIESTARQNLFGVDAWPERFRSRRLLNLPAPPLHQALCSNLLYSIPAQCFRRAASTLLPARRR